MCHCGGLDRRWVPTDGVRMLLPPALLQTEAPPLPPGWRALAPVGARIITVEGERVARVELWVDLPVLRKHLGRGPASGEAARKLLMAGKVRVLAATTYLVDIGARRRRQRLEAFFAVHWPTTGEDPLRQPVLNRYLEAASRPISMGDKQVRGLEPGWGLWFRRGQDPWASFGDPDLALAWARGELGSAQDPEYAKGLESDLARLLGPQRAR